MCLCGTIQCQHISMNCKTLYFRCRFKYQKKLLDVGATEEDLQIKKDGIKGHLVNQMLDRYKATVHHPAVGGRKKRRRESASGSASRKTFRDYYNDSDQEDDEGN